jgi:hypothetical protein
MVSYHAQMDKEKFTIQIKYNKHLRRESIHIKRTSERLAGLTSGGISVATASASQITPSRRKKNISEFRLHSEDRPHLFPKKVDQASRATTVTTQDEQAKEHDKKQDNVRKYHEDETWYARPGFDKPTDGLLRDPNGAKLWMG